MMLNLFVESVGQRKQGFEPITSGLPVGCSTTKMQETMATLGHTLGSFVTRARVLHTATAMSKVSCMEKQNELYYANL